jgi:hypothetical protein
MYEFYTKCVPTKHENRSWDYIITGRKESYRKVTEKWLDEHYISYKKMIMFPLREKKNNMALAKYKTEKIKSLGITLFYEDDFKISEYLKKHCPNTKIVYVKNK